MTASPDPHVGLPREGVERLVDDPLANKIARIIELAAIRHGADPGALEGTLEDASDILSLIRPAFEAQQAKLAQAVEAKVEIRRNDDGTIDEVVASGSSVHLEQLDKGSWHLGIYSAAGDAWQFWLSTDKPGRTGIAINHEHSPARSAAGAARGETP